jgi:hypothetical protein
MAMTKDQLLTEVRSLPSEEQEQLAEEILAGITDPAIDAAILAEVRRRDAEFVASGAKAIPIEQVLEHLERKAKK